MLDELAFRPRFTTTYEVRTREPLFPSPSMARTERLYALDAARFLAMLLMVQGHTLDALVTPTELDIAHFPWSVWHFLRGLTAPAFLVVSGIVHVFATRRDSAGRIPGELIWRRIRWALTLLGIGYLMMFPAQRMWHLPYVPAAEWTAFFRVHILQLIGVTLVFVLGLFVLTRTDRQLSIVGIVSAAFIIAAAPYAATVDWYRWLPEPIAAYMSTERGSLFPVVPFSAYLLLGIPIGVWLKHLDPEQRTQALLYRLPLLGILVLSLAPPLTWACQGLLPAHANPFHANPGLILLRFGLVLLFVGAAAWLHRWTRRWEHFYAIAGRYALLIFVGHLVLLYGTPWFDSFARWYPRALSLEQGIGMTALIIAVCLGGVYCAEMLRRSRRVWAVMQVGIATAVVYFLLAP